MSKPETAIAPRTPEPFSLEQFVAAAVSNAAQAAFCPLTGSPSDIETIKTCAALIKFLRSIEDGPSLTPQEWRSAIENLRVRLGPCRRSIEDVTNAE